MGLRRFKKYAIGAAGMLVLVVAVVLATGSGSAVAAQITNVFVTNDAAHPVPVRATNTDANGNVKVHEQGTANVNVSGGTVNVGETPVLTELREDTSHAIGTHFCMDPIVGSNLSLSAIGDSVTFEFQTGGACDQFGNYNGGGVSFALDVAANSTVSIPLHDRLPANYYNAECDSGTTCRFSFALVGQAP
jgi:hypothetical protein